LKFLYAKSEITRIFYCANKTTFFVDFLLFVCVFCVCVLVCLFVFLFLFVCLFVCRMCCNIWNDIRDVHFVGPLLIAAI